MAKPTTAKERDVARGQVASMRGMLGFQREAIKELQTSVEQAETQLATAVGLLRKTPCYERLVDSDPGGVTMQPIFDCGTCVRCTFRVSLDTPEESHG